MKNVFLCHFAFNATKISYLRKKHTIYSMSPYGSIGKKRVDTLTRIVKSIHSPQIPVKTILQQE